MIAPPQTTDGMRFVAARARQWSVEERGITIAPPALPLIDLGPGELDCPTAPHVIAAVAAALDRGETHYTARPGIRPLREALAAVLADESGIHYDPGAEIFIS